MTNPLDPVYAVRDQATGEFGRKRESNQLNEEYGVIMGSKPTQHTRMVGGTRNLNTQDIIGANTGSRRAGAFTWIERRQVRELNRTDDIVGGQADTLKRGPQGTRHSNPLNPDYQILGGSENINAQNDPWGERFCSMSKANFRKAQTDGVEAMKKEVAAQSAVGSAAGSAAVSAAGSRSDKVSR